MPIRFTIYPDLCDAFGHLNQASYLALFERARWQVLAEGPGIDVFTRAAVWPAVRRAVIEYHAGVWPGDALEFSTELAHRGRTSFTLRQRAVRASDRRLSATLETVFVCIDRKERPAAIPEEILMVFDTGPRHVTLPSGVTLAIDERGSGEPAVLFVHGYPLDRTMWAAQLAGITGHRLIAPDLRGFGDSAAGNPPAESVEAHADDLVALLDALGIARAVVVGLSMGGYVALALAERHRDRLAGLVLVDTRSRNDDAAGRAGRDGAIATIRGGDSQSIVLGMAEKLFAAEASEELRARFTTQMKAVGAEGLIAALTAMRDRPDRTALLPTLGDLPTLIMVGREDRITPLEDSRAMAEAVPGATLVVVEGAGHLSPAEQPDRVNQGLQAFLEEVGRRGV